MLKKHRYVIITLLLLIIGGTSAFAIDNYLGIWWFAVEIFIFLAVIVYVIAKDRNGHEF